MLIPVCTGYRQWPRVLENPTPQDACKIPERTVRIWANHPCVLHRVAQAADLWTKALPSARTSELLAIWGLFLAQHTAPRGSGGSLHTLHCWRRCALSMTHCNVCLEESPNGRWSSLFKRFKRSRIHHILQCMLRGVTQWSLVLVV